ncbi:N-acetyltransferase [Catellatospora sp. IY07-71]|uniref:GNAT family N-acetyltransferase n=1 Tax=Catellatospora sp. IY07-71 TaxID=2728827 RepID=UPI001BB33ADA|nr:GNAT family N-acetyltransferase [Catellatospora sp. IY07-71]BCJ73992.1 N-acetyltransferase [Catellatospora sp. IY07-71]
MAVTPFDPRLGLREQLACWHEVERAAAGHDDPGHPVPPAAVRCAELLAPRPDGSVRHWLACADGTPVGLAELFLSDRENLAWGFATVTVHPAHRRAGHGSALLAAARAAAAEAGRDTLVLDAAADSPGPAWAAALGARRVQRLWESEADLSVPVAPGDTAPPGYRLERWPDGVPEALLGAYAAAVDAMADSPDGGLGYVPAPNSPQHVRAVERHARQAGRQRRVVAAVHEGSGAVAGLTVLEYPSLAPELAHQEDTVVVPAHRGHGLGLWVKAEMLRWLAADGGAVRRIRTTTEPSNVPMLRINERLGFRRIRTREQWTLPV